ncbi:Sec20-domain protein [Rhizoctonia solani AG-3 Rhs1AP]|uniref:Sec20-domain protein n=1 Tax=Rhizoctonia solani AG-3 Rhs1AP TaxID=1086054 RepID=X8IWY4_9AGAM|nr:Sec20-domain protein [Rhizoctonia solani AG-3 Rhs1AP]
MTRTRALRSESPSAMPPIASPLFIEAQTTHEGISRRLRDINKFQIPRLRECKGPLTLQQQFAAELRDDTEAITKRLEDFSTLAEDQERENERVQVGKWVSELYDELARLKSESRAALLASKRAIDNDARSRRDELLGSAALQEKRAAEAEAHKQRATEDKLMAASDDVTEALRRTTRLMQQELERSVLSTQMLQESSNTLRSTTDVYASLDNLMDISQVLIKALQRADWMDRIIIGLSFSVFLLTMAYIVKKRVLDRVVTVATLPFRLAGTGSSKFTTTKELLTETTSTIKTLATSLTTTDIHTETTSVSTALDTLTTSSATPTLLDTLSSDTSAVSSAIESVSSICSDVICEAGESATSISPVVTDVVSTIASRYAFSTSLSISIK